MEIFITKFKKIDLLKQKHILSINKCDTYFQNFKVDVNLTFQSIAFNLSQLN